ncbi:hypothetical protein [Dactylosporangium sp. NPDC005555]|uniref:hypothetical protein n=1 Tax=Dactylosporangium sp. NPDC005555 TaxID=3154889 RepID=UPI0033B91C6B
MLVDVVPRWSVLAFATAHVLGLLIHHPVPWTGSLTAVSLLHVLHSYRYVETAPRQGDLPPAQIHPGIIEAARATEPAPHDAVLAAAGLLTLVALTAVLLPARARRPEPLR